MPAPVLMLAAALGVGPTLSVAEAFVPLGTSAQFAVGGGIPGAPWIIYGSLKPAEIAVPGLGKLLIDPAQLLLLGQGTLDGVGGAQHAYTIPSVPSLAGAIVYAQAGVLAGPVIALSNNVAVRAETAPLLGPRAPDGLVASLDGTKLYTSLADEGALAVVSAATGAVLRELPIGPAPRDIPFGAMRLVLDPDGTRLYALNALDDAVTVIDTASDSIVARIPVPRSSRGAAVTTVGGQKRLWVSNDAGDELRSFTPAPPFGWAAVGVHPLAGRGAGSVTALSDGRLIVAHRVSRALELLDANGASLGLLSIGGVPRDVLVDGGRAFTVAHALPFPVGPGPRFHSVLEIDLATFTIVDAHFENVGTDYVDLALRDGWLLVVAHGSGTLLVADRGTMQLAALLDLNPAGGFAPSANPVQADFTGSGPGLRAWTADYFRDALRPIALGSGPPFFLEPEVPVSHSGQVLSPLLDLPIEKDGDWWFRSVQFFNGTPLTPNPVTCYTCHPDGAADGLELANQRPALWEADQTGPWGSKGLSASLLPVIQGAFAAHTIFGGEFPPGADFEILAFMSALPFPPSPFLAKDGVLTPAQSAGRALFEGQAKCATCHAAPLFMPPAEPFSIAGGVGTGLVPANVPSLRAIWSTPPFFKSGAAPTLFDVLLFDSGGLHGETAALSFEQRENLVEYLKTL